MVRFGADEIFASKSKQLTDEDIDVLLKRAARNGPRSRTRRSRRTRSTTWRTSHTTQDAAPGSLFEFEGANYRGAKGAGLLINLPTRERKRNYDVDEYFRDTLNDGSKKRKEPREPADAPRTPLRTSDPVAGGWRRARASRCTTASHKRLLREAGAAASRRRELVQEEECMPRAERRARDARTTPKRCAARAQAEGARRPRTRPTPKRKLRARTVALCRGRGASPSKFYGGSCWIIEKGSSYELTGAKLEKKEQLLRDDSVELSGTRRGDVPHRRKLISIYREVTFNVEKGRRDELTDAALEKDSSCARLRPLRLRVARVTASRRWRDGPF